MTKRAVSVVVAAALALAGQPALAQRSRGGGHAGAGGHPGGGHPSGGHAVPRGGGPGYMPGGAAQARHPRAGTGGAYYGYGHYPGYGYGHYPAYGYRHYYRPYYGGYYPYYGGSFGLSFGFGWPYGYGSVYYGWPYASYGYGRYGYGDSYPYASAPTTNMYVAPPDSPSGEEARGSDRSRDDRRGARDSYVPNTGRVRLEVRPDDASVYVDDEFWGTASESRSMTLRAGRHAIELVRPGFDVVRREVDVAAGGTSDVLVELQRP